jgi:hypothetical protein
MAYAFEGEKMIDDLPRRSRGSRRFLLEVLISHLNNVPYQKDIGKKHGFIYTIDSLSCTFLYILPIRVLPPYTGDGFNRILF